MPSPGQFDHVITAIPKGDGYIWMDTTAEVAPFGYLFTNLRDKYALIIPEGEPPVLIKTPSDPSIANLITFAVEGKLDDKGILEARIERTMRGDIEILLRAAFRKTPQPQWKDVVQNLSYSTGFAGTVDNIDVGAPDANDVPFRVAYDYKRKDYPDWDNRKISMPCPPFGLPLLKDKDEEKREKLELGSVIEIAYDGKVTIPAGFAPDLPAAVELKEDFAEYHSTYEFKDGVLHGQRRLVTKVKEIRKDKFEAYRAFAKAANEDEGRFVRLKNANELAAAPRNPEADELMEKAQQAWQRGELNNSLDYLQKTVELVPNYPRAWLAIGTIHAQLIHMDEALQAFRKAADLNPNDVMARRALGGALMASRKTEEGIQHLKKWRELAPTDPEAAALLGKALIDAKEFKEAVPVLQSAVELKPKSYTANYQLGLACLEIGDLDNGVSAFKRALDLEATPTNLNNIAYKLADMNLALPDAIRFAEQAASLQEQKTTKINLEKLEASDVRLIILLAAIWDTVGWAHFRSGNLDLAHRYVSAGWSLSQDADSADHLGQILEKQGKKVDAIRAYAWAVALREKSPEIRERLNKLAVSQTRAQAALRAAREDLSKLRTVKLRYIVPKYATAEFFVLFSQGPKVEGVKFISGAEELRGAAKDLAAAKFDVIFPDETPAQILRRGIMMCHSLTKSCEFVFLPPDSVQSVD